MRARILPLTAQHEEICVINKVGSPSVPRWLVTGAGGRVGRMLWRHWQEDPPGAELLRQTWCGLALLAEERGDATAAQAAWKRAANGWVQSICTGTSGSTRLSAVYRRFKAPLASFKCTSL